MSGKKKPLSLETKQKILCDVSDGILKRSAIAAKYGIPASTLSTVIKNREQIETACAINQFKPARKRMRTGKNEEIEVALLKWIKEARNQKIILTGIILQEKAKFFARTFGVNDFVCSNGWLSRFKERYSNVFKRSKKEKGAPRYLNRWNEGSISISDGKEKVITPEVEMQCSVSTDLETQGIASASFMSNTGEQMNEGSISISDGKEEVITPEVEMQCFGSTEMGTQKDPSTGFLNSSDIVLKQEIIETELDPCTLDDSSFLSSIAGPSGMQFDGQRPSTSYQTDSESSNSNTVYIFPDRQANTVSIAPTLSHELRTLKVEPDVCADSRDVISETNNTFYSGPSILNVTEPVSLTRDKFIEHRVPPLTLNITDPPNSPSNEPVQIGITSHTESPSSPQILDTIDHGDSHNNESIQIKVSPHSNPILKSGDKFDAFGEFIAFKLRKLDPKSITFVQTAVADIIFKAELGMFLTGNDKSISDIQTVGIQNDTPLFKESEITHGSSEKENIQPKVSSLVRNPIVNIISSENLSRNETTESKVPSHKANSSFSPVVGNTGTELLEGNETTQPRISSHVGNLKSQVLNFAVQPRDEFDSIGEFTASKLRNLDPRSCAFVQTAFANLIIEAELGRFLNESEKSIFTNKTNDILSNMSFANDC